LCKFSLNQRLAQSLGMKATLLAVKAVLALSMASAYQPVARVLPRRPAAAAAHRLSSRGSGSSAVLWTWDELRERSGPVPDRVVIIGDTIGGTQGLPGGLTLFRDRNGWCPYSERVWLAHIPKGNL